jgi:HlyD family secretion protein
MDIPLNPELLRSGKRRRLAAAAAIVLALPVAAYALNRAIRPSIDAGDVIIAEVKRGAISNTISASGIVIPVKEELVTSPGATRVAKVHARPGKQVQAGELLLELDDKATRLAVDALKEQLAQAQNRIASLTLEMEQKRKQLLSSIELLELDLRSAQAKYERYKTLRASGGVSGEDMLTAELNVKRAEIQLRQQKELIDDTRKTTNTAIEGARLQQSILSKQMQQQMDLLAQAQVRAPFDGMLTWLVEEEGASLAPGQLVARVSQMNNYKVEATLSDFHARSLSAGQAVQVEHGGAILGGKVQTVLPEVQNGTIKLIVTLDKPDNADLRNKLRVETRIITEHRPDALVLVSGPAFNGRGIQPAFRVHGGEAVKTSIELGANDGKHVEIVRGAKPGDRFIVSATTTFKDRESVRINE